MAIPMITFHRVDFCIYACVPYVLSVVKEFSSFQGLGMAYK